MRMELNVSYYKNGHNLSLDPTPCFLIPIIIKSYKVVTMETQALVDYGAFACFTNKELVWQHKLSLMKKNTPMPIEVIDDYP